MSLRTACIHLLAAVFLAAVVIPVLAETDISQNTKVIYQTPFSSDPRWETNSPSSDYWDPATGRYHFSIEPSTQNYAWKEIPRTDGSFTFEYDVTFDRVDDGATFRFGLTSSEMDFNKGPNVITMFSNGKHGKIMSLHLVTVASKQMVVNSKNEDYETSGNIAYKGPTVRYELNKTYHVVLEYDDDITTATMRVSDKASGKEVWVYYLKTVEKFRGMTRIFLGSKGDYGQMYTYARGYIDNVRLTVPGPAPTPVETAAVVTTETTVPVTTKTITLPTALPKDTATPTPESPAGVHTVFMAIGIITACMLLSGMKKS
ncbi:MULTISPECIES: hypothetical protein [unclassified Methanoregula]|uniref:hypothetical protein n=1 Tax=unclassified Methanoregula TaxID=2649730 RepID=UPI0009D36B45|nr:MULTISPECIES: hypothetical protein [unclassified Methanoregula]OPX63336.1 MAG: hypothetical protein A4E33_01705 [Methanoregula sp. PtaB.Bin085]OPY35060.1 MAG: hypothetical protein A4E34_01082 [Methanoregula sp. PtaU1.Bin006]